MWTLCRVENTVKPIRVSVTSRRVCNRIINDESPFGFVAFDGRVPVYMRPACTFCHSYRENMKSFSDPSTACTAIAGGLLFYDKSSPFQLKR